MNINIPISIVLLLIAIIFGSYGWRRGWVAEVVTLAGILFSWLVVTYARDPVIRLLNQFALGIRLFMAGGLDSPNISATVARLRENPLITETNQGLILAIFFGLLVLMAYAIPNLFMIRRAFTRGDKLLGLLVGFLNGILTIFFFIQLTQFNFTANLGLSTATNGTDVEVQVNTAGLFDELQKIFFPLLLIVILLVVASIFLRGLRAGRAPSGGGGGGGGGGAPRH
jgi:hypothetical protein